MSIRDVLDHFDETSHTIKSNIDVPKSDCMVTLRVCHLTALIAPMELTECIDRDAIDKTVDQCSKGNNH